LCEEEGMRVWRIVAWLGYEQRKRCKQGSQFATPVLHLTFALGVEIFLSA
jgi:hypothetical protein